MKLPIITTLVIALSFLAVTITEAKVYKWKDAEGVLHYSSIPPKPTEKVSGLQDDFRITNNKAATHKAQATKPAKKVNEKSKKRNYCNGQRKNLELLKRNLNVKWIEGGKSKKLSAEQRKNKLRSLEENIRTDCSYSEGAKTEGKHYKNNKRRN